MSQSNQNSTPAAQALRRCGLRITRPRLAVLEWLLDHSHATVEQVHHGVGRQIGAISKQAVYDVLSACLDADLVRQIKPSGHPARYERRTGDNHHHLVCRGCGRIEDTDCRVGMTPCLMPEHDHDFNIDEAEVVFWGIMQGVPRGTDSDPGCARRANYETTSVKSFAPIFIRRIRPWWIINATT